jgi:ABC-2 type transport system ATP-binding protein
MGEAPKLFKVTSLSQCKQSTKWILTVSAHLIEPAQLFFGNGFILRLRLEFSFKAECIGVWTIWTFAMTALATPAPVAALSIQNLVKNFGAKRAVDTISIELQPGAFYGLLGANGAGKTTTMRMVAGLLAQDLGTISVYGKDTLEDPRGVKSMVAWLPDEPLLYDKLTPLEYLEFICGLWSVERPLGEARAEELLRWLDLWEVRDQRCEGFSRGMRQKTALAGALIHDPKLLLLDEPFSGLDAAVARQVKDLLVQKTKEGCTIVLTTHVMEIAQRLAETIAIISNGKILAEGDIEHLRAFADMPGSNLEDLFITLVDRQAAAEKAASPNALGKDWA